MRLSGNRISGGQGQLTQHEFVTQHGIGLSTLSKWLRLERDAVPAKVKFQEVRLPNPASRWPVELVSPQGWIVRLQNGSDVQMLPERLRKLPCGVSPAQRGCWAHARRGFHETLAETRLAAWFVGQIRLLYAGEKKLREQKAGPALRQTMRVWQSQTVLVRRHRGKKELFVHRAS
jgi:hypothetical protein